MSERPRCFHDRSSGYPSDPGRYDNLPIYGQREVLADNGYGQMVPCELTVSLNVTRTLYYGHIPILKLSGFRDELSGRIITNAFSIGIIDPEEVERTRTPIASDAEVPSPVMLRLTGLIGHGLIEHGPGV